jgi:hypothetical protein
MDAYYSFSWTYLRELHNIHIHYILPVMAQAPVAVALRRLQSCETFIAPYSALLAKKIHDTLRPFDERFLKFLMFPRFRRRFFEDVKEEFEGRLL